MPPAPTPENELARLRVLTQCSVLDTGADEAFDAPTRLAARLCGTPIALVSLVDADRQWFKARVGLEATQTPRSQAFCAYTILSDEPFVVEDATTHPLVKDNPLVTGEPHIRFYAGVPLRVGGARLGSLCAIDFVPRRLEPERLADLRTLGDAVEAQLALLRENRRLARLEERRRQASRISRARRHALARANDELRTARDAADAAARAASSFLANISHEIRTPLNAVLNYAELLADAGQSHADAAERLASMRRAGAHLLSLVNDVLDLSKIESGALQTERVECSPAGVLADVRSLLAGEAARRGLELRVECRTPLPERARTDPTRLRQIVVNLVSNALKFTPAGAVSVEGSYEPGDRPDAGVLRVDVRDTGPGIPPEVLARLFQPFTQADAGTTRAHGGTGLGLAISRRLARALGGDVTVDSRVGAGSVFTARVAIEAVVGAGMCPPGPLIAVPAPRTEASTPSAARAPAAGPGAAPAPLTDRRVLVVDDTPDNRLIARVILSKAGAVVEEAANGRAAIEAVDAAASRGRPFDLVLMDLHMPEMDGCDATRKLRAAGHRVPVVALTADAVITERDRLLAAGCDDHATKPISRDALLRVCARWACARDAGAPPAAQPRAA
jgi:signal transduction histidine kinase/ActR/RegA family two-component response regulator